MEFKDEKELIDNYLAGRASEEEARRLETWYNIHARALSGQTGMDDFDYLKVQAEVWLLVQPGSRPAKRLFPYWQVAAACIAICLGVWFYTAQRGHVEPTQNTALNDLKPGKNTATLTFADGTSIDLGKAAKGELKNEQHASVRKTADGELVYARGKGAENVGYHILSTPRAGKFTLTLADGTVAILDAASSIRYPVAFIGGERRVSITGQVYFKVFHNELMPFRIDVQGQTVEDLGTEFNINAYTEEQVVRTTLIEGAARVLKGGRSVMLKPGQQASVRPDEDKIMVRNVDTEEATAWKNGYFLFDNEPLESVMRKISRWYDVDIVYSSGGPVPESYLGSITRYGNVSKVLQMLEATGDVRFRVDGRKIIVTKKSTPAK